MCNVIPNLLVIRVENMCAILVDIDALYFFRIYITCNIRTLVYN